MKVVEIRAEDEMKRLLPAWRELVSQSAADTIFLTAEWASAWWAAYGETGQLRILAALDDDNQLRGIAPLRARTDRRYGQTVPTLSFVGDGSFDSDYLDFIIWTGYEEPVMKLFLDHLRTEMKRGVVLLLNEVPEQSSNVGMLRGWAAQRGMLCVEESVPCGAVRLPGSWEEYLRLLRPRFRTKVRSVLRTLETHPEIRFGFCQSGQEIEQLLPVLFDLHTRRWTESAMPGVFGIAGKRRFYEALSPMLLERGWLRFSWMKWKGAILACQYGFSYRDSYYHLQEGYEPAAEHWSLGIGLRAWSLRQFIQEGLQEYDFLGGVGRHKLDWGASIKNELRFALAAETPKTLLFCRGAVWERAARESVQKMIPAPVLAARTRRIERRRAAAFDDNCAGSVPASPVRSFAAGCYYHLHIPALMRPLRERYNFSVSRNGRWPFIACGKRQQPAARILYYHRVNDHAEPFSPATPTHIFEQQIRFVASHYKVVPLEEVVDRLSGGSPEPVVAITFDDGYRDNFTNAFPILQRYGVPATIFLSTGAIDSGEPLWFERLAMALKHSPKEFIDVELDLPRRFWLRTQEERLESNACLFSLLRSLPDDGRQQWLEALFERLETCGVDGACSKMLTWDQARQMYAHGIGFGGHTVTHPFLSKTTPERAAWEVGECKRRIEMELQASVDYFAYPNGRREDIEEWNKDVLRVAGYRAAVTTVWGMNDPSTDPLELRRGQPWEESPEMFAYKLDWYQLLNA